ncbi:hypothetical protein ACIRG5_42310 [Lentzea sp. NPDC102401]|uniref:hypothetical protein n=1 Tax=Lentzea sp. NPDC102401 TaxID=3364128 RepID=UPI00380A4646
MAAITATFDATLSRVVLQSNGWAGGDLAVRYYVRPAGGSTWDTVRGAQAVPVSGGSAVTAYDYEFPWSGTGAGSVDYAVYSAATNTWAYALATAVSITATAWLKVVGYPTLNRKINPNDIGDITRSGRNELISIIAQGAPAATADVMGGRSTSILIPTTTWAEYKAVDDLLRVGGIVMLHSDEADLGVPTMYAVVERMVTRRTAKTHSPKRRIELQLAEVAKPHYAYAGSVGTYQSVLNQHATYQDVLNTYATYLALAQIVGSPADVVVG